MKEKRNTPTACKIVRVIKRLNIVGPSIHAIELTRGLSAARTPHHTRNGGMRESDGDMSYLLDATDPVRRVPEMSRSFSPLKNLRALLRLEKRFIARQIRQMMAGGGLKKIVLSDGEPYWCAAGFKR